jgi:endo-alpha-1,4-polygalactosaminidase (GH114 family)
MISILFDTVNSFLKFIAINKDIEKEKKEKMSEFLLEISNVLNDTAEKLLKDEYPHNNCAVMEKLSTDLLDTIREHLPENISYDSAHKLLLDASHLEKHYANRKDEITIPTIQKAAGEFKALSMISKL